MWCSTDVKCLQISWPTEIRLSYLFNTFHLRLASTYENQRDRSRGTVGCKNGKSMATNIHYGKNSTMGLRFYCLGSGRWVAESWSPPLTSTNELLECHLYLLQWAFYVGVSVAERIRQGKGSKRCKHCLSFLLPGMKVWSGVLTIAVCTSAGIWQLLKYRAEVGTWTNGGLEVYRGLD